MRVFLCILLPPLAVLDFGCGSIAIVALLTLCGWVPGTLAALFICLMQPPPPAAAVYHAPDGTRLLAQPRPPRTTKPLAMAAAIIAVVVGAFLLAQMSNALVTKSPRAPASMAPSATVAPSLARKSKDSQQAAVKKYPQLGVANSSFNRGFLALYERWKAANDPRLGRDDWPELLADEYAAQLIAREPEPTPWSTPIDIASQIYTTPTRTKSTATPTPLPIGRAWVNGYTRKDGTYVQGHYRER